jgi:hypothetical protein
MRPLTWDVVTSGAAWLLVPATTGLFVAVHFDTMTDSWRRRFFEMVSQGLATGVAAFVAARIWLFLRAPEESAAAVGLFSAFVGGVGALIGAILGLYLPHKHRRVRRRPRDPYLLERLDRLTHECELFFKDKLAASRWLNTALTELDGLTPMGAAYTTAGAARARECLLKLQQPQTTVSEARASEQPQPIS